MSKIKVTYKNQSGGTTASRVNSPDIKVNKIVTRQRAEGFISGVILAIVTGVVGNLIYDWLFK